MLQDVTRPILVDKGRQMRATWTILLYADWECRFVRARRWLFSKLTEDEAIEILDDKPRHVDSQLPSWVRAAHRAKDTPRVRQSYLATGSYILAVPQNVAERACRGGTASGVIVDEAARQSMFGKIWVASQPMTARIIAPTTAEIGNPGARFFKSLIDDKQDEAVL